MAQGLARGRVMPHRLRLEIRAAALIEPMAGLLDFDRDGLVETCASFGAWDGHGDGGDRDRVEVESRGRQCPSGG